MIRVLVVDDDYRVAELHAGYVTATRGFAVAGKAHTAAQAVSLSRTLRPDLILLDQYLPDRYGTEVLPELTGDVLMVTATADAALVRAALGRGAVGYVIKPFEGRELISRLGAYARYRARLASDRVVAQAEVDNALRALHGADERSTGSRRARATHTGRLVADALRCQDGPISAGALAERIGVSRPTAQRYLADLASEGAVRVELRYGAAGRPEHLYSWHADGRG